ncbi:hypothetical protein [Pelolinea submarina]|uniref:Uncharacterized protein n=1 Tax=Pelolinea submarina TaxID=913107 RepID=A0A347ZU35_9CHLR|nr:hypothetical protein [Pelolinea submarina]REG10600.1 hypothetical protein DFR64_0459 [Pelolinea submarina]BBB48816.1 hypothetical protein Pelsub_P2047 [Pelolinea submarina]
MKSSTPKPEIQFSTPRELNLECPQFGEADFKYSQAFPDLTRFNGRFYLAFRAAPSHFPSVKSRILIYSSPDAESWQLEHVISDPRDLRDPHFLLFRGRLHIFYMSLTHRLFNHEPEQIYYLSLNSEGWSTPQAISASQAGFWNVKTFRDTVYMSIYTRNGTDQKRTKRHFRFIASNDLEHWETVFDSPLTRERLRSYQTSEASFDFDPQGNIFGTIRSLIYPNLNFLIPAGQPDQWRVRVDRFKCDGPNLFRHNGRTFLVARRSLFYHLSSQPFRFVHHARTTLNVLRYSLSRKRTAIYSFDPADLTIRHITDLPSHGDTGYSAIAPISENQYLLIYYSSDINMGKDFNWIRGQLRQTRLYASTLTVEA